MRRVQHHRRNDRVTICLANGARLSCPPVPPHADPRDRQEVFSLVLSGNTLAAHELAEQLWIAAEGRRPIGSVVDEATIRSWLPDNEDEDVPRFPGRIAAA